MLLLPRRLYLLYEALENTVYGAKRRFCKLINSDICALHDKRVYTQSIPSKRNVKKKPRSS